METDNPFGKLIVGNTQEANMQELADLLEPFVIFVESSKSVDIRPEFQSLPNKLKLLVVLAASKAKAYIFKTDEKLAPKEIIGLDLMAEGSVKSSLKELYDAKEIKSDNQKYYLPGYRISALAQKLQEYKKSDKE